MNKNFQFFYSVFLALILPLLVIAHSIWLIRADQKNLNSELRKKAELATTLVSGNLKPVLGETLGSQQKINEITRQNTEIKEITLLKPEANGFNAYTSSNQEIAGLNFTSQEIASAWTENKIVTWQVIDKTKRPSERSIFSSMPLTNQQGEKIALINLKLTPAETDFLARTTLQQSLVVLLILVLVIILLLANQVRLSQYPILYKKLEDIDKMKDEFISVASHELKTPLAAAKGYSEMLLGGLAGKIDDKARSHLEKIMASVQRLNVLVDELLDVSRLQQDRMQFDMLPVDVHQLAERVAKVYDGEFKKKRLEINIAHPKTPLPLVFADPDKLQQVFENLIANAIKYTFKGSVDISYAIDCNHLKVLFIDTGIGMSEKDSEKLFEKFYRIKNEKTIAIPGTGLGLWISREIARKMNAEMGFSSVENKGSEFYISLPIIHEGKCEK